MNENAYNADAADPATRVRGDEVEPTVDSTLSEPVGAVVSAYLDFLEGQGEPPELGGLNPNDRCLAKELLDAMRAGRGIDPHASPPSLEELLAGTEMESALPLLSDGQTAPSSSLDKAPQGRGQETVDDGWARAELIQNHLHGVDPRATPRIEPHQLVGPAVTVCYLDLRVVFVPVELGEPVLADEIRLLVDRMFELDSDLDHVGVVAAGSDQLLTLVLSCGDLAPALITPSDQLEQRLPPVLPLPYALRRLLELAAPEWEPFTFNSRLREPLDLAKVAAQAAQQAISREVNRRYRGEKNRAYKSFAGTERVFADLIVALGVGMVEEAEIDAALERIAREAA